MIGSALHKWVSAHPLATFVLVTYGLTWSAWLGMVAVGGQVWDAALLVGVFSPALACLLVSRMIDDSPRLRPGWARWVAFVAVWLGSTAVFGAYVEMLSGLESPAVLLVFAVFGLLPATVIASAWSSSRVVRRALRSLIRPPGSARWYLVALLLPPAVLFAGEKFSQIFGWGVLWTPDPYPQWGLAAFVLVTFAYMILFAGGLNEETGWTGFVLPRLLGRMSPLTASVLLWALWITWHLPFHFSGHWNAEREAFVVALVGTFFARLIFTWLFLRSGGGLWTAILFHSSANASYAVLPATGTAIVLFALLALLVVFTGRMWQRDRTGAPASTPDSVQSNGEAEPNGGPTAETRPPEHGH